MLYPSHLVHNPDSLFVPTLHFLHGADVDFPASECGTGVSWPSGLVHRTQVLVLSENQNVGSIPGSGTCVLEQDT